MPAARPALVVSAQNLAVSARQAEVLAASNAAPREAISYTVPAAPQEVRAGVLPARLTSYVFAHSRYSSGLDLRGVMADMLIESEEQPPAVSEAASRNVP
jgi:hypothetical protein